MDEFKYKTLSESNNFNNNYKLIEYYLEEKQFNNKNSNIYKMMDKLNANISIEILDKAQIVQKPKNKIYLILISKNK